MRPISPRRYITWSRASPCAGSGTTTPGRHAQRRQLNERAHQPQNTLAGWNSDIPRLRDDVYRLHLTPLLFFTLNLRGRLQGISNGFGACVFLSPPPSENADLSRRTGSPKRRINRHRYLPHPRTRLCSSPADMARWRAAWLAGELKRVWRVEHRPGPNLRNCATRPPQPPRPPCPPVC